MNKQEYEAKRDELAYAFDGASWYGRPGIDYFKTGFNSGYQLAQAEIEGIREQLLAQCKITHELLDEKAILNYQIIELRQELQNKDAVRLWNENEELKRDASELISALKHTWPGEYGQIIMEFNKQFLDQWNSKHGGAK